MLSKGKRDSSVNKILTQSYLRNLKSIEHVWDEMERQLRHLQNQPVTLVEIGPALIRMWNNIQQALFNNYIYTVHNK
jgi:hypothetical protein